MHFSSRTLAAALLCSLLSPVAASPVWAAVPAVARQTTAAPATAKTTTAQQPATQSVQTYDLHFHPENGVKESLPLENQQVAYYAYRNLVYVAHPRNPEYEQMNLFVPAAYLEGKTVNGYTAKTAPIFLPNNVGGYMPGKAGNPSDKSHSDGPNTMLVALSKGYVVASPAVRGRSITDARGSYVGKAPALIVDYKAAVRYLRHNANRLPAGDTEKIISNGTSAGGALSALLGATGNSPDYEPYLKELGAAEERDDIYASMDYCPITDLPHADLAYEWVFNGVDTYYQSPGGTLPQKHQGTAVPSGSGDQKDGVSGRPLNAPQESQKGTALTAEQKKVSARLKALFPAYVNSLGLKDADGNPLTLDQKGNGSFKEYIEKTYMEGAQKALDAGTDLSRIDWLKIRDGKVVSMDLAKYAVYATRLKPAPAFDRLDGSSGENDEFGTETNQPRHFSTFGFQNRTDKNPMAPAEAIRMLSPLEYIGKAPVTLAEHWRIRHGEVDRDTALPVPAILALKLQEAGKDVDFATVWGKGHAGDYDLEDLFVWMDRIGHE